jgi:hypothetical protein
VTSEPLRGLRNSLHTGAITGRQRLFGPESRPQTFARVGVGNLGFEFRARLADPDWVMAHFTLAADLTTLEDECRFAHAEEALVARYQGLPFPALAFLGQDAGQLSGLAAQLVGPDEPFYLLLNEGQAQVAERAFASPFCDTCHFTTARERGIIIVVC